MTLLLVAICQAAPVLRDFAGGIAKALGLVRLYTDGHYARIDLIKS